MSDFHPLVIGCPVWMRDWAMPLWFEAAQHAASAASVDPAYLFVADPRDSTVAVIEELAERYDVPCYFEWVEENSRLTDKRVWNPKRFERMAYLRNLLLGAVRQLKPAYFLSLDSDIFLHPQAIASLMENVDDFDAVGGKTYMTPPKGKPENSRRAPSCALFTGPTTWVRPDHDEVIPVDVIMAIKLMGPRAYAIDYEGHEMGEDIGWSLACKKAGVTLGWDGRVISKHVMRKDAVFVVDDRCGY